MNHSRHWSFRAGTDVCGRSRDGAGGREPSEQWRKNVRDALSHKFHIRVVFVAAHAVGNDRGHQRFDCA